jgi:hypothetical protein
MFLSFQMGDEMMSSRFWTVSRGVRILMATLVGATLSFFTAQRAEAVACHDVHCDEVWDWSRWNMGVWVWQISFFIPDAWDLHSTTPLTGSSRAHNTITNLVSLSCDQHDIPCDIELDNGEYYERGQIWENCDNTVFQARSFCQIGDIGVPDSWHSGHTSGS